MKKIFLLSLMAIVCQMMQAQEKILIDSIYYTINNGEATVCGYVPDANGEFRLNIPRSIVFGNIKYVVTKIGQLANYDTSKKCICTLLNIPNSVKKIEKSAFYYYNNRNFLTIHELVIPESVDTIGEEAFRYANIKKVTIQGNPIRDKYYNYSNENPGGYGSMIFDNCTLEELDALYLEELGSGMFSNCTNLKKVNAPLVKKIHPYAFIYCNNLNYDIPKEIEYIGQAAFMYAGQNSGKLKLPNPLPPCLSEYSFYYCRCEITLVHLSAKQAVIPNWAFTNCNTIKAIELDEGITNIGKEAFMNAKLIESIFLPSTISFIDGKAFWGCKSLRNVYSLSSFPYSLKSYEFGDRVNYPNSVPTSDATLHVPVGCTEAYKAAGWGEYFSEIIEMDEVSQRAAFAKSVTGVTSVIAPSKTNAGYFNLQGQKLDAPQKGINILRTEDGKARKVYVK